MSKEAADRSAIAARARTLDELINLILSVDQDEGELDV